MGKRTNFVTRRVIEKRTVKVYSLENGTLTELDTLDIKGKISEKELAEKYKVKNVVTEVIEEEKAVYGVPVDKFMEIAVRVDKAEETEKTVEKENN